MLSCLCPDSVCVGYFSSGERDTVRLRIHRVHSGGQDSCRREDLHRHCACEGIARTHAEEHPTETTASRSSSPLAPGFNFHPFNSSSVFT
jgi:hypothetical protein